MEIEILNPSEGFNENNKRIRPGYFDNYKNPSKMYYDNRIFENFNPSQIKDMDPFTNTLSTLPGYKKPKYYSKKKIETEEERYKIKKEDYERNKEEIRQIMRLNQINKKKGKKTEFDLMVFVEKHNPKVYITGRIRKKKKRRNKKYF